MESKKLCAGQDLKYRISRPIRRTVIFSLEILEKNYECILILVIYWKKTGLYVCIYRVQNVFLRCPTPTLHCFLSSHWPSFRFLSFMAFFTPSIQFFFGLPRALFCFGIHCNAILDSLSSAILKTGLLHTKISNHNIIYSSQKPRSKFHYLTIKMLYNRCTGICKFGNNTYPRRIRRRSNLGHIFREKKCVLWAGKYGILTFSSLLLL